MVSKQAAWILIATLAIAGVGPSVRAADSPEQAKDGADRLFGLLDQKRGDKTLGEAWLNRHFKNDQWFAEIERREAEGRQPPAGCRTFEPLLSQGVVAQVTDGDTVVIELGKERMHVRLHGVDTTEKLHPTKPVQFLSAEASQFTRDLAFGQTVRVEYDQEKYDKYCRVLAYVYLPDGRMLNEEIIRAGMGYAYTRFPFKYQDRFLRVESEAQAAQRGLWAEGGVAEYRWLVAQKRDSFDVFEMSENLWGVRVGDMVLVRITSDQLRLELEHLRKDVHALGPKDLDAELAKRGYVKLNPGAA